MYQSFRPEGRSTLTLIAALTHEVDDGEGDLGGSRTFFTIIMDYLCQRLHVSQPLKLPIHLHIVMEELVHSVDFFFHPSRPLSLPHSSTQTRIFPSYRGFTLFSLSACVAGIEIPSSTAGLLLVWNAPRRIYINEEYPKC